MNYVGLSTLIEYEMNESKLFSIFYGSNYKVFTANSDNVQFSLTKSEKKKVTSLTKVLAAHIVMVVWPLNEFAIQKNKTDIVNKFIKPIYVTCKKHRAPIAMGIYYDDSKLFLKSVKNELASHDYTKDFNGPRLLIILSNLINKLEIGIQSKVEFNSEFGMNCLEASIKESLNYY